MKYANLHLHSIYSDGVYSPRELCALAVKKGYRAVALTDHETTRGIEKMQKAAAEFDLEFLTGMEMVANGCGLEQGSFHVVALDFDPNHPRIRAYTEWTEKNVTDLSIKRFDYCVRQGFISGVTWEDVVACCPDVGWYCNEQVFIALKKLQGVKESAYWEFVQRFNGAPVRGVSNCLDAQEVIDVIRAAGGIAVLAHPHEQTKYLPALKALGLGGVEVCHPDLTKQDEEEAVRLAVKLDLYQSGGTDHTGLLGASIERGEGYIHESPLIPFTADVSHGATKEHFEEIRNRIKG